MKTTLTAAAFLALAACSGEAAQNAASHADSDHGDAHVVEAADAETPAAASAIAHGGAHGAPHVVGPSIDPSLMPQDDNFIVPGSSKDGHGMEYNLPSLDALGGTFDLLNAKTGGTFTDKELLGSWTLVYLGYMECLEACPIALKSMPAAITEIQAAGIPAKAVFIDINAPRLDDMSGAMGHGEGHAAKPAAAGAHGAHGAAAGGPVTGVEVRRQAIADWSKIYDPSIVMLSGTRKQLNRAKAIFKSRVEQSMMPTQEVIHHLNHTTTIYVMNPQGKVAGILYHSDPSKQMAATVKELARPGSSKT